MPKPHRTEGDPNDLVPIQVRVPLWLKLKALEDAKKQAKDLSEWLRSAMVAALENQDRRVFYIDSFSGPPAAPEAKTTRPKTQEPGSLYKQGVAAGLPPKKRHP